MSPTSTAAGTLKTAVRTAVEGIRAQSGDEHLAVVPDGNGGAWVEVSGLGLGDVYLQDTTFLLCQLHFNLPGADVYPVFLRPDLARADGQVLGAGFQTTSVNWPGSPSPRPVVQVSRRTRNQQFTAQTPAQKIEKVLEWIRTR